MIVPLNFYGLDRPDVRLFSGAQGALIPALSKGVVYYVLPRSFSIRSFSLKDPQTSDDEWRVPTDAERVATVAGPDGKASAQLYRVMASELRKVAPRYPSQLTIGDALRVIGYDLRRRVSLGQAVDVTVYWRALRRIEHPGTWQMYTHLLTPDVQRNLSSDYNDSPMQSGLLPSDLMMSRFRLTVPEALGQGVYQVSFGVFNPSTLQRLDVVDSSGNIVGSSIVLSPVRILGPRDLAATPAQPMEADFADNIRLTGYDLGVDSSANNISVRLYWAADGLPAHDYTVFVHLLDRNGKLIDQKDNQPQHGQLPTTLWDRGDQVLDEYQLHLPADASSLSLDIGLYRLDTGERVPVLDAHHLPIGDHILLPVDVSQ